MESWNLLMKTLNEGPTYNCDYFISVGMIDLKYFDWFLENYRRTREIQHYGEDSQTANIMDSLIREILLKVAAAETNPYDTHHNLLYLISNFLASERLSIFVVLRYHLQNIRDGLDIPHGQILNVMEEEENMLTAFKRLSENFERKHLFLEPHHLRISKTAIMWSAVKELQYCGEWISSLQDYYFEIISLWEYNARLDARDPLLYSITVNKIKALRQPFADLILSSLKQIGNIEQIFLESMGQNVGPVDLSMIRDLKTKFIKLLEAHLSSTILVEKHPPLAVNKGQKFSVSVSHSVDKDIIGESAKVYMINEDMAKLVFNGNVEQVMKPANCVTWKMDPGTNIFSDLSLNDRPEKTSRKGIRVMEDKLALLFTWKINVLGNEVVIWTISLPLVIASHYTQKDLAFLAVLWDIEFAERNRIPFEVCDSVTWEHLVTMLNRYFFLNANRNLTDDERETLKRKLSIPQNGYISRKSLGNEKGNNNLRFWEWFYEVNQMINVREGPLGHLWKENRIVGIIDRTEAEKLLINSKAKDFILRISHNFPRSITVVWHDTDGSIKSLAPIEIKKNAQSLAREVMATSDVQNLYPSKDTKKKVFENEDTTSLIRRFEKFYYVTLQMGVKDEKSKIKNSPCKYCGCGCKGNPT